MSDVRPPIHVIRLHAAWRRTERNGQVILAERSSVSLPDAAPVDPSATIVSYQRKFNLPTGLEETSRVQLASDLLQVAVLVQFNGLPLDIAARSPAIDITARLQKHNQITIDLPAAAMDAAQSSTAQLHILSS